MTDPIPFDLDLHTFRLLQQEPFFAALSRRIHKYATKSIPTAGVKLNESTSQFEMVYNPDFFAKMTDEQKSGVLMHEFYHIIFEHVTGRLPAEGMSKLWNRWLKNGFVKLLRMQRRKHQAKVPGVLCPQR